MSALVWHFGLAGTGMAALLAAAWFSPVFKKEFIYAALVVGLVTFVYARGVHDEKVRRDQQEQALIQNVRTAVRNAILNGTKDPYDDPAN